MKTNMLHTKRIVQALALAGLVSAAAPASAMDYYLRAEALNMTMPDGAVVPMWGFALDGLSCPATPPATCAATVPGPALTVPVGEAVLNIHLKNALTVPVSVVIPGQKAAMVPVKFTDASGRQRVRSLTAETAPGTTTTYSWNSPRAGTYLYHSGTHPQVQVQMGLYGAVTMDAAAGQPYPGIAAAASKTLVFSEIDPALHTAVTTPGGYGPGTATPSTLNYHPKYFLVNGKSFQTTDPTIALTAGQTTLLRLLNAGIQTRVPVINGLDMKLVAEDGNPYPWPKQQYSTLLPALKTVDAVITPQASAAGTTRYSLYDRRLGLVNNAMPGEGGMFVKLEVAGAAGNAPAFTSAPVLTASEGTPYSYQLTATDADGDALSYSLTTAPTGMAVNAANGLISWTPAANQTGNQAVTAKVTDATGLSATQAFTVAVSNVNNPPVANADAYQMMQGGTLSVGPTGVLANDTDADGNPLTAISAYPAGFAFNLAADGSFTYTPPATFTGTASFQYQAADNQGGISAPGTVNITVQANRPPLVVDDTASATLRQGTVPYPAVVINVLGNDSDPDTAIDPTNTINPASVFITVAPNKGGTATVNANGTISYRPKAAFIGTETFRYKVRDTQGVAASVAAYVRVNVVR